MAMRSEMIGKPLEGFAEYVRAAAAEGAVLLKNEGGVLPLKKGERIAVFGRTQTDFYRSGTGSGGSVNVEYTTNLLDGLRDGGVVQVDEELAAVYAAWLEEHPFDDGGGIWAGEPWNQQEMAVSQELVRAAAQRADKALIVIGRTAGEDRDYQAAEGSYLLTRQERDMIRKVTDCFEKTTVVMNVSNIIDMSWLEEDYAHPVSGVIYVWQGGIEGGNAAADVLTGKVTPSGKLTDTIAWKLEDYPSHANYGSSRKNVHQEDIYVGYRYFETFCPEKVQFPFGYGLSYTSFRVRPLGAVCRDGKLSVTVEVENTGTEYSGREVVQVYVEAPQGQLGRPRRELAGFAKTPLLAPGESAEMTVEFPVNAMAAYDDLGVTGKRSCYVLEAGTYRIWAGTSVRQLAAVPVDGQEGFAVEQLTVTERLTEASAPEESFLRMKPGAENPDGTRQIQWEKVPARTSSLADRIRENLPAPLAQNGDKGIRLADVKAGRASLEAFVAQLSDEDLAAMTRGEGMCSPRVTPGCAAAFGGVTERLADHFGIPVAAAADGPYGIRMDVGARATQVPIGTLLACSWDVEMMEKLYEMEGRELLRNEIDTLLGPGINIHRHPLNGRNFEYYSEDPLVTGKFAAAMVRGIARSKAQATVKHMACNTQESSRHQVNAVVSERALREIYLKGFEISVKEGGAKSIMTSYNPINGHWSASNYDMLTVFLRGEWGFDGIVMTDWWAHMNDPEKGGAASQKDTASMIRAQNDLYMVVDNYGAGENCAGDNTLSQLAKGRLTRGEMQRAAMNICRFLLQAPVMNRGISDFSQRLKLPAGEKGEFHRAGAYDLYVTVRMDADPRAQGASNIYVNQWLVAPAQTNGTEGKSVRKLLAKVELEDGCYEFTVEPVKAGVQVERLEFVPAAR